MNLKMLFLGIISGVSLLHSKEMSCKNNNPKSFFNFFRYKRYQPRNQLYVTFKTAGYFCSDDPDEKVIGRSYLRMAKRAYPKEAINEETLFDVAAVFNAKGRMSNSYYLVPHNVVKNLKNGDKVPVKMGAKQINAVVRL